MKNSFYKKTVALYILSLFFMASHSFAVDLAYPVFTDASSPGEFVGKFYIYALSIASTLAVVMIVYGGVKYVASAGSVSAQGDARDIIQNALFGILLLGGAYLILNTINPDITSLKNPGLEPLEPMSSAVNTETEYTHDEALRILNSEGISVYSSGGCSDQQNATCTSLEGIPRSAVCRLVNMKYDGTFSMTITGGTEVGHIEHGVGQPVVDIRFSPTFDSYVYELIGTITPELNHKYLGTDGSFYMKETDHWHINLSSLNLENIPDDCSGN